MALQTEKGAVPGGEVARLRVPEGHDWIGRSLALVFPPGQGLASVKASSQLVRKQRVQRLAVDLSQCVTGYFRDNFELFGDLVVS